MKFLFKKSGKISVAQYLVFVVYVFYLGTTWGGKELVLWTPFLFIIIFSIVSSDNFIRFIIKSHNE